MITIHCITSAHLDPVWMWPWTAGLDEAIATCRSACDRLDAHPELFFTQGEAWTFAMIERADPPLFARIARLIAAGRWEVVNGWWTQPDCNLPSVAGLHAQIATGLAWVRERFGVMPRCGFNPDSFGHCAALPEVLRDHGQDRYVFMRPQGNECALPARLFRWRSRPDGREVTAFRIADTYALGLGLGLNPQADQHLLDNLQHAVEGLPPGCRHTMAFFGIGNHGGGPTERIIAWMHAHRDAVPGARLEFSTVDRFFTAVAADNPTLPVVTGELQHHAVGCYTAVRSLKAAVRRAELALDQATHAVGHSAMQAPWRTVCSHQFHDTLGGTSTLEACRQVMDQLGGATAAADEALAYELRRRMAELPDDHLPRIVLGHLDHQPWSGWCEATAYVEGPWRRPWRLLDRRGTEIPYQLVFPEASIIPEWFWGLRRVLFQAQIAPDELRELRCDHTSAPTPIPHQVQTDHHTLTNDVGVRVQLDHRGAQVQFADGTTLRPLLQLIDDQTDTWSHGIDRYADEAVAEAQWEAPEIVETGPLRATLLQRGSIGTSRLHALWRVCGRESWAELLLTVDWSETQRVLKLRLPMAGERERHDGTPGMGLRRANDGCERPLHDATLTDRWSAVCPDAFGIDATPERLRFTLLRSPFMAQHDPAPPDRRSGEVADQGRHCFRFRFTAAGRSIDDLQQQARCWQRPPLVAELTRGMPARMVEAESPRDEATRR